MKFFQITTLILATFFLISCGPSLEERREEKAQEFQEQIDEMSEYGPSIGVRYVDEIYGYYLSYPSKYESIIDEDFSTPLYFTLIEKIEGQQTEIPSGPGPRIFVTVDQNKDNVSALEWAQNNADKIGFDDAHMKNQYVDSEYEKLDLDGIDAIKFSMFRLGYFDKYILPIGEYVLTLNVEYSDPEDTIKDDFEKIVETFRVLPEDVEQF